MGKGIELKLCRAAPRGRLALQVHGNPVGNPWDMFEWVEAINPCPLSIDSVGIAVAIEEVGARQFLCHAPRGPSLCRLDESARLLLVTVKVAVVREGGGQQTW